MLKRGHRRLETGQRPCRVIADSAGKRPCVLGMIGSLAVAVHVHRQRDIALLGQHVCAPACIVVQPPPLVNHQHPGASSLDGIVIGNVALHVQAIRLVQHLFAHHRRLHRQDHRQQACEQEFIHGISSSSCLSWKLESNTWARMLPNSAMAMSFCVSHTSPWVARNATASSPDSSATAHSISS